MKGVLGLLLVISLCHTAFSLNPIIFTPGWTASILQWNISTSTPILPGCPTQIYFTTLSWPLNTVPVNCLMAWLTMVVDVNVEGSIITEQSQPGVTGGILNFNSTYGFQSYYNATLQFFRNAGWVDDKNLFVANWDWRISPLGQPFWSQLQQLIEDAYTLNGDQQVYIMGHSSGPVMAYSFLGQMSQAWKTKYIKSFVILAGAVAGQSYMVEHNLIGTGGLPWDNKAPLYKNNVATFFNEPFKYPVPSHFGSQPVASTPSRNYTASDIRTVLQLANLTIVLEAYDVMQNISLNPYPAHPGVDIFCVWGTGFPTSVGPIYNTDDIANAFPTGQILVTGDGTHDDLTNTACTVWKNNPTHSWQGQGFPGVSHSGIVVNTTVMAMLVNYLLS